MLRPALFGGVAGLVGSSAPAIGVPVHLAAADQGSGSSTLILTTLGDAPAGSVIQINMATTGNLAISSVADNAGNTYAAVAQYNGGGNRVGFSRTGPLSVLTPAGTQITVTWASALGTFRYASAAYITGLAAAPNESVPATGTLGNSNNPAQTTSLLSQDRVILISTTVLVNGSLDSCLADGANGWTAMTGPTPASGSMMRSAYKIINDGTTATHTRSETNSSVRVWTVNYNALKGA